MVCFLKKLESLPNKHFLFSVCFVIDNFFSLKKYQINNAYGSFKVIHKIDSKTNCLKKL